MKLDSTYFDRIRIKPEKARTEERVPGCDWPGCDEFGRYPAPKGRDHEGQYHLFCLDHVRGYNKSYNYFAGMSDTDVMSWQRRSVTGHRPTWPLGARAPHTGRHDPHRAPGAQSRSGLRPRPSQTLLCSSRCCRSHRRGCPASRWRRHRRSPPRSGGSWKA
jgi:hypothetical protein